MSALSDKLNNLLADTYALYLKTQCYHWNVKGPQFKSLHELFEGQYQDLAEAVDEIAERVRMTGSTVPANFKVFDDLKQISDGDPKKDANSMVKELAEDHRTMTKELTKALEFVQSHHDEASANLLSNRIASHEKMHWMLDASRDS